MFFNHFFYINFYTFFLILFFLLRVTHGMIILGKLRRILGKLRRILGKLRRIFSTYSYLLGMTFYIVLFKSRVNKTCRAWS